MEKSIVKLLSAIYSDQILLAIFNNKLFYEKIGGIFRITQKYVSISVQRKLHQLHVLDPVKLNHVDVDLFVCAFRIYRIFLLNSPIDCFKYVHILSPR